MKSKTYAPFSRLRSGRKKAKLRRYAPCSHLVIEHGRRHILHFGATFRPTAAWVIQQLCEAFPFDTAPRHLILDRDSIFSVAVVEFLARREK